MQAQDANYKKLKEVEEKLINNKETYLELIKVEKEIKKNLNKIDTNINKYRSLIKKGLSEKKILKKIIIDKTSSLKKLLA